MKEIVAKSCRNAFATVFLYAISSFLSKGGFILPYPVYEILFFVVSIFLYFRSFQLKQDLAFFRFLMIISFVWMCFSIFFLQIILPHQYLDSFTSFFPISDLLICLFLVLISVFRYRANLKEYKSIYFLFSFLILSKWGMFLFQ
jgi:hypothetical protein